MYDGSGSVGQCRSVRDGYCSDNVPDCVGSWGAYSSCSVDRVHTRTFTITTSVYTVQDGGVACAHANGATQTESCVPRIPPAGLVRNKLRHGYYTTSTTTFRTPNCGSGTDVFLDEADKTATSEGRYLDMCFSGMPNQWMMYLFDAPTKIEQYSFNTMAGECPAAWTLHGTNDDSCISTNTGNGNTAWNVHNCAGWNQLDSVTGQSCHDGTDQTYTVSGTAVAYKYILWKFSAQDSGNGNGDGYRINTIGMYGTDGSCQFDALTIPSGTEVTGAGCTSGGIVANSLACYVFEPTSLCTSPVCYDGVWAFSTSTCSSSLTARVTGLSRSSLKHGYYTSTSTTNRNPNCGSGSEVFADTKTAGGENEYLDMCFGGMPNQWMVYSFSSAKSINQYSFKTKTGECPSSWVFLGSNDDSCVTSGSFNVHDCAWTTLDTETKQYCHDSSTIGYVTDQIGNFKHYAWKFSAQEQGNGNNDGYRIQTIGLYEGQADAKTCTAADPSCTHEDMGNCDSSGRVCHMDAASAHCFKHVLGQCTASGVNPCYSGVANLDGRGGSYRYSGGWALSNGFTGDDGACGSLCQGQTECSLPGIECQHTLFAQDVRCYCSCKPASTEYFVKSNLNAGTCGTLTLTVGSNPSPLATPEATAATPEPEATPEPAATPDPTAPPAATPDPDPTPDPTATADPTATPPGPDETPAPLETAAPTDSPEAVTTYQWYRSSNSDGSNAGAISGETSKSYSPTSSDADKYLFVDVTVPGGSAVRVKSFKLGLSASCSGSDSSYSTFSRRLNTEATRLETRSRTRVSA